MRGWFLQRSGSHLGNTKHLLVRRGVRRRREVGVLRDRREWLLFHILRVSWCFLTLEKMICKVGGYLSVWYHFQCSSLSWKLVTMSIASAACYPLFGLASLRKSITVHPFSPSGSLLNFMHIHWSFILVRGIKVFCSKFIKPWKFLCLTC